MVAGGEVLCPKVAGGADEGVVNDTLFQIAELLTRCGDLHGGAEQGL